MVDVGSTRSHLVEHVGGTRRAGTGMKLAVIQEPYQPPKPTCREDAHNVKNQDTSNNIIGLCRVIYYDVCKENITHQKIS